ncbi:unnamed protein product [Rhizophagus irregularis]|nr:unnamed protein product [Rhizophagus irregularis]
MQKERCLQRENEGINYPDHFALESVKERLAELKTLRIADVKVTGYVKNRNQEDLPQVFRSMEKSEERASQLLSWVQNAISSRQLRDPGAVFAVVVHEAKNLSNAMTIANLHVKSKI